MQRGQWRWAGRVAFLAALAAVTAGSLVPAQELPGPVLWDKAQHALGHGTLYLLLRAGWPAAPRLRAAAGLLGYGILLELAQAATGYRTGDVLDVLANATGIALAALLTARRSGQR